MPRPSGTLALRIVAVAAAYYLFGRLSILLGFPPGYAKAIQLPAGIAMAAAILWGRAILPGVCIGSFGISLLLGGGPLVAAILALCASLQTAAGLWVARRFSGPGNPLDNGRSVLSMLFVSGLVSGLVGASLGVGTLLAADLIPLRDAAFTVATWWAGDTIGILVLLPPLLAWSASPEEIWRVRRWTLSGPLLACLTLVGLYFVYARDFEQKRAESEFSDRARPIVAAVVREIERATDSVASVADLFRSSERVERHEFAIFCARTIRQRPGFRALEWAPFVREVDRTTVEDRARAENIEAFTFTEFGRDRILRPANHRETYAPVLFIEPAAGNERAFGFDLMSEPVRNSGIEEAIRLGGPTVTTGLQLLQVSGPELDVLLFVPVYVKLPAPGSEVGSKAVEGLVVGVLIVSDLVENAYKELDLTGMVVRVRDRDAPSGNQLLFGTEPIALATLSRRHTWQGAGRKWEIEVAADAPRPRTWSSWALLAGGLLFTGLFGAFVLELATRQIHVESLVDVRTRELARANDELQRSNLELQRFAYVASHDLREPLRAVGSYAQLLDEMAPELSPPHRNFLQRLVAAARRMQALVDDLLALSRLEAGATNPSIVPLRELVDLALENLQPAIAAAGATVEILELPDVPCDPSQMVQLFQNLIANAVKFRREGVPPVVRIGSWRVGDRWEIAVKDNGIGIAPEYHTRIFEMFERLHARERYGGTGIGLAICRRVVDRHGGRIWVESLSEGGSMFRFTLPARSESA